MASGSAVAMVCTLTSSVSNSYPPLMLTWLKLLKAPSAALTLSAALALAGSTRPI